MTAKPLFSVEIPPGEDTPAVHLFFEQYTRIQVASTLEEFDAFIAHLRGMRSEISEHLRQFQPR